MGLFDKFRKKPESSTEAESANAEIKYTQQLLEIAMAVSYGNEDVIREISNCISDTKRYFNANREQYEERSIKESDNLDEIKWIGLVNILIKNNYVCERDWKDDKDNFIYFVQNLAGIKTNNICINPDWLSENDSIAEWCPVLDDEWKSQGMCMAAFDIGSDSYVLFPYRTADLKQIKEYATQIGQRIDYGKDM